MADWSSAMVSSKSSIQSLRAIFSRGPSLDLFLMAVQPAKAVLTSYIVLFKVAEINSGRDLEARSGRDTRVETQSSGYSVPLHAEWTIWMCLLMCNRGISMVSELNLAGLLKESRVTTRIEMGKRMSKRFVLPLEAFMVSERMDANFRLEGKWIREASSN
ncbi:hypothetical protein OIU74_011401 [Salix koriyanagi]|uniref:Uncharacterized protein n=1 Tax=Salix koriyanagi TaxID=2511006 RepID=A0A9Q0TF62_9ROSI|nr:hypothetical protein OIU74_011401 [Salix koriyanagi]